ncbi:MAG: TIGR02281 family clan AA aspartic protease [Gammaproteobacteria bacterium]|nr:TIGR02281 family clan AA aspartic protease [Gammaproteobacteria bacterium]
MAILNIRLATPLLLLLAAMGSGSQPLAAEEIRVVALFGSKVLLTIDGNRRMLTRGESSPEGVKLIKSDSDGAWLEQRDHSFYLALDSSIGSQYQSAPPKQVTILPDLDGMYRIEGEINDQAVEFLVDTGAQAVVLNRPLAERLGIRYRQQGDPVRAETASGITTGYQIVIHKITVGTILLHNTTAIVIDGEQPSRPLLGLSFLSRLELQQRGKVMELIQ